MGKKRITEIGEETPKKSEKGHIKGMKGGERIKIVGGEVPDVAGQTSPVEPANEEVKAPEKAKKPTRKVSGKARVRGKRYQTVKSKVEANKFYSLGEAVALAKETSIGKFDGSVEAHFVTVKTGLRGDVILPHLEGKTRRVAIANPETLAKIESGKFDFDVLLSTPAFMPNLVKHAKTLGPRGLMPNPKNGTVVENPEKEAEKFRKATISYKTESSAPLVHFVFGKTSQKQEELEVNLKTLIRTIGSKNIKRLVIASSMGPGIKVDFASA